ncbi:hypothetical protein HELRODRAFT_193187 [Helobdella robusta]|uniref:Uncharacterized protein n=1 Tax=Helobdella robusta TaxID=6412 RepID=T1FUQ2_HELRO|nr:hypothetical protein HELRODRAFT_193187 [Helobdella robusta]ESN97737.1 hypothetical protein HELRODRAFT_193187 [Helobdella robusta]
MKSSNEDVEGSSTIHYIMRSIQEKEELKMRGNKLNAEVSQGERELKGMQNAAALIQCKNKVRVKKVTDSAAPPPSLTSLLSEKESLELKQLEGKMAVLLKEINIVKREMKDVNDEAAKMKTQIDGCIKKHQNNLKQFRVTEFQMNYKSATHPSNQQISKKLLEIELLTLEKLNELALQQFFKVMYRNDELSEFAINKFDEMGLTTASKFLNVYKVSRSASSQSHFKIGGSKSMSHYFMPDSGHSEITQSIFVPKDRIFKSTRHMAHDASLVDPRNDLNMDISTYLVRGLLCFIINSSHVLSLNKFFVKVVTRRLSCQTDKPRGARDDTLNM